MPHTRAALVTGANSGIGYAIDERLLCDGFVLGTRCRPPARGPECGVYASAKTAFRP